MNNPFYKTKRWEHKRELILKRDGYRCQISASLGKNIQANTVHHIFPLDELPEYAWESWNLISVSNEMHERLHDRTNGTLNAEGIALLRRTARRNNIPIPLRYEP